MRRIFEFCGGSTRMETDLSAEAIRVVSQAQPWSRSEIDLRIEDARIS